MQFAGKKVPRAVYLRYMQFTCKYWSIKPIWSIKPSLRPCNNNHFNRVSKYKQYFNELYLNGFDFTIGFKSSDVHKFKELNNLSVNVFELTFCQDQNKWRNKLIPIEVSKNKSDRVIDLAFYKNHYLLNKKLDVFLGDHNKKFICRQCLSSYTSENMLMKHKQKSGDHKLTIIKIFIGTNIFIRIFYIFGYMLISKLIMRKIILV